MLVPLLQGRGIKAPNPFIVGEYAKHYLIRKTTPNPSKGGELKPLTPSL